MSEKITFKELVELIAKQSDQSQSSANSFISELVEIIEGGLKSDGNVSISGFGKFELRWMKERTGTNPQTGEKIIIPGQNKVVFKPYKALRESVNAPYANLETKIIEDQPDKQDKQVSKPITPPKEVFVPPVIKEKKNETIDDLITERDNPLKKQEPVKEPFKEKETAEPAEPEAAPLAASMKPDPKMVREVRDKGTFNWSFAAAGIIAILAFLLLFYIIQRGPVAEEPQLTDQIEVPALVEENNVSVPDEVEATIENDIISEPTAELIEASPAQTSFQLEEIQIQPGQSLWSIAEAQLGNPYLWPLLYHLNQDIIDNPNVIASAGSLQVPVISNPDDLNEYERDQVARGYLALYDWNRENNPDEARFFLWAVGVFSADLLENLPSEVDSQDLAFALSR